MHRSSIAILALSALLISACGQKGALYLPDRNAKVITRPAAPSQSPQGAGAAPATNPEERKKNDGDGTSPPPKPNN
jgi:predicted small lipoprotein YifL